MISQEPHIKVGVIDHCAGLDGTFNGEFNVGRACVSGEFHITTDGVTISLADGSGTHVHGKTIRCTPSHDSTFTLHDVIIGIGFHWEREESQTFRGDLFLVLRKNGTICAINDISLENYLASVISSEMSAEAPIEFLEAHAITSRSWLVAMLERSQKNIGIPSQRTIRGENELIRWYDREDHDLFDVCADDHCQRYQGVTKIISGTAAEAVAATHGTFLVHDEKVCDARFSKACGGFTEVFETCWEDTPVPYLQSVSDAQQKHPPIMDERQSETWIRSHPEAYCNATDAGVLRQVLPSFDQETMDFFRWKVEYRREELEGLIRSKSGIDVGMLMDLVPVRRGPSGRIFKLKIEGTKKTLTLGKELEIRRWLSKSHLYSSAFLVETQRDASGVPTNFSLRGAGWGHGVGFCQIGAAVMATQGFKAEEIVRHYFRGAEIRKLYQ